MTSEQSKFKKFYAYGSLFWLSFLILYFSGSWVNVNFLEQESNLLSGILSAILIFGVFGIPIIFILSLLIRVAEYIINRIPPPK